MSLAELSFVESLNPSSYKREVIASLSSSSGSRNNSNTNNTLKTVEKKPKRSAANAKLIDGNRKNTATPVVLQLRIGTQWGIRLEQLVVSSTSFLTSSISDDSSNNDNEFDDDHHHHHDGENCCCDEDQNNNNNNSFTKNEFDDMIVLLPSNNFMGCFMGRQLRISAWGAPVCKIETVTLAKYNSPTVSFLSYDASDSSNSSDESGGEGENFGFVSASPVAQVQKHENNGEKINKEKKINSQQCIVMHTSKYFRCKYRHSSTKKRSRRKNGNGYSNSKNKKECRVGFSGGICKSTTFHAPPKNAKHYNENNNNNNKTAEFFQLHMSDNEESVQYIWIIPFSGERQCTAIFIHQPSFFHIENTCGSCISPHELNLECFNCLKVLS